MTVSVISVCARGEDEISVTLEIRDGEWAQRESFILSALLFADMGIRIGECDRACYDDICCGAEQYRAVKRGLNILGFGACSEKGLYRKLISKGFSKDTSQRAVEELTRRGFLNASEDAYREAEKCVRKLWGRRRIATQLYEKGYSDEAVKEALFALEDDGVDFTELCVERLRQTVGDIPDEPAMRQKLIAGLSRYGFSSSEIREAIKIFQAEQ